MAVKADANVKSSENVLVEVEHNVEKAVERALVRIEGAVVEFVKGKAQVTPEVAQSLKDAGVAKA